MGHGDQQPAGHSRERLIIVDLASAHIHVADAAHGFAVGSRYPFGQYSTKG